MSPQRSKYNRSDLEHIAALIQPESSVLDLGCGTGELLDKIRREKNVQGHGIEIYDQYVLECITKGVPVVHSDLDVGLDDYMDASFDYVVLSQTLQQVKKPDIILREMLRVGKTGIVGLLNFGYWRVRHYLAWRGEMPKSKTLPYEWYDTPNIHLSTIRDFRNLCQTIGIDIRSEINLTGSKTGVLARLFPNSFAELSICVIEKQN